MVEALHRPLDCVERFARVIHPATDKKTIFIERTMAFRSHCEDEMRAMTDVDDLSVTSRDIGSSCAGGIMLAQKDGLDRHSVIDDHIAVPLSEESQMYVPGAALSLSTVARLREVLAFLQEKLTNMLLHLDVLFFVALVPVSVGFWNKSVIRICSGLGGLSRCA